MLINNEYKKHTGNTFLIYVYIDGELQKYAWQIDARDIFMAREHSWRPDKNGYLKCWHCNNFLHRLIMKDPRGVVDHLNRDIKNNTRKNLRVVTHAQNMWNRGSTNKYNIPVGGITLVKNRWRVVLIKNGIKFECGSYDTLQEAICSRIRKEYEMFGEYSKNYQKLLNKMPKELLLKWFPEIYSQYNLMYIGKAIYLAHFKNKEKTATTLMGIRKAGVTM